MASPAVAAPPAPELQRNRTTVIGTAFASAAVIMLFVGMFAIYISIRQNNELKIESLLGGDLWFPEGAVQIAPGTMMMFTTWISVTTMAWAVQAIRNDDRRNAYFAMVLTMIMGGAVINQMVFAIGDFAVPISRSTPSTLLYTLYGSYIVLMAVAIGFLFLMFVRAVAGQFNSKNADGIEAAAIFWYATVILYHPIWYLITITK